MTKYIYADLLKQYAEIAQHSETPWDQFQIRNAADGRWETLDGPADFSSTVRYRRKPLFIKAGDYEFAVPEQKELDYGEPYYFAEMTENGFEVSEGVWEGLHADYARLQSGLIQLREIDAEEQARALNAFLRGDLTDE